MRRIEYQDADEQQYLHAQTIPKAFGFEAATRSTQAYPSLRDEAATRSTQAYPSLRDEAATRPTEKKGDLKKQSQFAPGKFDAKSYLKGSYENKPAGRAEENKAKQSQFPALEQTKRAGKKEKLLAAADSLTRINLNS